MKRDNNFAIIRLFAASFVFAGHLGQIIGGRAPLLASFSLHEIGVFTLFLMSGYLITMSWLSDPHPVRFAIRRFFRLWPPFAVMILLIVFVAGPLLSDLGIQGYFQSWYRVYLRNLRFYIIYALPGVFTNVPLANTVNGSLWTMPVEAALYVLTPLLLTVLRVKGRSRLSMYVTAVLTGVALVFDIFIRAFSLGTGLTFYGTGVVAAYHLIVFYMIGILFTYEEVRKCLNLQVACIAVVMMLMFQQTSMPFQYLMIYLVLPYFVFSFAFAPHPVFHNIGCRIEPSYGIYLYGFFFEQLVVSLQMQYGISITYTKTFILSAIPTLIAATLSYYLVEMPAVRFGRFLIKKQRSYRKERTRNV